LVRGFLDELPAPPASPYMVYYTESAYIGTWPYIPKNLTHFSVDDYHPSWMYPSTHGKDDGLWVLPIYEREVYPKLGNSTKLLVVPPAYGSHNPCTSASAGSGVWCTNQSYSEWITLNLGNLTFYRDWAFREPRIVGFDPWPLTQLISAEYGMCTFLRCIFTPVK